MARTEITKQQAGPGAELTFEAANVDGNSFLNDGNAIMVFKNDSVDTAVAVTLQTPATVDGLAVAEATFNVAFGEQWIAGSLPPSVYNRPQGGTDAGRVYVDYDGVADLTVAVIEP
jgi:hypothetical protein